MNEVYIGKGKYKKLYEGKRVYAARDFDIGEVVVAYHLKPVNPRQFALLLVEKQPYVHSFWGEMFLFSEPACFVNHSPKPNTRQDLHLMSDIAVRPIKKGEMITTNATIEVQNELETFVEAYEQPRKFSNFRWLKGGYRNAEISYTLQHSIKKQLTLRRIDGNFVVLKERLIKQGVGEQTRRGKG